MILSVLQFLICRLAIKLKFSEITTDFRSLKCELHRHTLRNASEMLFVQKSHHFNDLLSQSVTGTFDPDITHITFFSVYCELLFFLEVSHISSWAMKQQYIFPASPLLLQLGVLKLVRGRRRPRGWQQDLIGRVNCVIMGCIRLSDWLSEAPLSGVIMCLWYCCFNLCHVKI